MQVSISKFLITLNFTLLFLLVPSTTLAQADSPSLKYKYKFGEYITFTSELKTPTNINHVRINIEIQGIKEKFNDVMYLGEDGNYSYDFPLPSNPIPAYAVISAWLEVETLNGKIHLSRPISFTYEDNRYEWQSRAGPPFIVYWYEGNQTFGMQILDICQAGLKKNQGILPFQQPQLVKIYAYNSANELRSTLQLSGHTWIGAHADPDLSVIMLSLPKGPEQKLEMERQIPHELMHILLYNEMGVSYNNLPVWLNEGLASMAELSPNPDYVILLQNAYNNRALMPMESLCTNFPREAANAFLAYAQSASFTNYLYQNYGSIGLQSLVDAYQNGLICQQGVEYALGQSFSQIELSWRSKTFGEVMLVSVINQVLPWFLIMLAVLAVPLILSLLSLFSRKRNANNIK